MFAAHLRNDAETTGMIAAFCDLQKRGMSRSKAKTRGIVIRNISRTRSGEGQRVSWFGTGFAHQPLDDFAEFRDLVQTDEGVDLGHRLSKLVGEPLRHATADNQLLMAAFVQATALVGLEDRFDRFFLGRIDKGARIDYENVCGVGIGCDLHPALQHTSKHYFGVDQVLGATEADHSDFRSNPGG